MKKSHLLVASLIFVHAAAFAQAQDYPSRVIRLIVPFAPGGTTDIVARIISDPLSRHLGQPVVIDNKPGAGGVLGTQMTAQAAPDGYTLSMATPSTAAANPAFNPKVQYRPTDFSPIINMAATPGVLAVHPSFPARNYADFIAELKRNPTRYSYASAGTGGVLHLQMENFKSLTQTFITHIPYRGAGPALVDTVAGQTQVVYDGLPSAIGYLKSGQLIPILVAAPQRLKEFPEVPTFAEAGLKDLNRMAFFGMVGPKGMPKELVNQINVAVLTVLRDPQVQKRIVDTGSIVVAGSSEQFGAEIKNEFDMLKEVVQRQKLSLD